MRRQTYTGAGLALAMVVSTAALGDTFDVRIVERVGSNDVVIPGNLLHARMGSAHRLRLQVRVNSAVPGDGQGGFIAWNVGRITATGGTNTRTGSTPNPDPHPGPHGRLFPFFFAPQATADGSPTADPFTALTAIDAAYGIQSAPWTCDGSGQPASAPTPTILGLNTFVSVYEITTVATASPYTITYSGNIVTGSHWNTVSCPSPDCGDPQNPSDDVPSSCQWAPLTNAPRAFTLTITVQSCAGDWNADGVINSQDFFDFLTSFFANDADANGDGQTNSDDYFAFAEGFFAGCL